MNKFKLEILENGYILSNVTSKSELKLWCEINQAWYLESGKRKYKIDSAKALDLIAKFKWRAAGKRRK